MTTQELDRAGRTALQVGDEFYARPLGKGRPQTYRVLTRSRCAVLHAVNVHTGKERHFTPSELAQFRIYG